MTTTSKPSFVMVQLTDIDRLMELFASNQLQITPNAARAAIARLKKQHLVRHIKDPKTGETYYRLNPWMVRSTGSVALQTMAMREFEEA